MKRQNKFKIILHHLLEDHDTLYGRVFGWFIVGGILLSFGGFVLSTIPQYQWLMPYIESFDLIVLCVFAFEYVGRVYLAPNRLKFITSPLPIIDLVVLISFAGAHSETVFFRFLRVLKIFQIFKIIRYSDVLAGFFRTFKNYRNELHIFWLSALTVWVFASCVIYFLEKGSAKFATLPDCMWWALVTMTTVGYGDMVPVTWAGKTFAGVVVVCGLGIIAILTAIITKIFMDHFFGRHYHVCGRCDYSWHDFDASYCKNCGAKLDVTVK